MQKLTQLLLRTGGTSDYDLNFNVEKKKYIICVEVTIT